MAEASSSGGEASEEEEEEESDEASSDDESFSRFTAASCVAMTESSSSGGEGSEDEDSDEASPSDGEITAASPSPPRHTNKRKKLCYVQDYRRLQRLPKHQRRRIQKEIDKGYKPGEPNSHTLHQDYVPNIFPDIYKAKRATAADKQRFLRHYKRQAESKENLPPACSLDVGVGKEFDASQLFRTVEDSPSKDCAVQQKPVSSRGDTFHGGHGTGKPPHNPTAEGCEGPTAPAELTLQEVAAQVGLKTLDVLDQECSQQVLLRLAKHCVDWQLTGFHLELTKSDIVAVDEDYRTAEQKRVEMLRKWKEKFAFKATYRVFVEALLSCRKASDAIDACRAIVSSIKVPTEDEKGNLKFSSTMSDDDFFKWLRSKGISEKDCNTLSGNGVTAAGFSLLDEEHFNDLGLTIIDHLS